MRHRKSKSRCYLVSEHLRNDLFKEGRDRHESREMSKAVDRLCVTCPNYVLSKRDHVSCFTEWLNSQEIIYATVNFVINLWFNAVHCLCQGLLIF